MKYLLDTNAVIALLSGEANVNARVRRHAPAEIGISSVVAHELYYGAYKSRRRDGNVAVVDALRFEVLDFDREDARRSGEVRAVLGGAGRPIGPYDVLIAGQAMARGLTLVSHNIGEFGRVAGLVVEDWQA